MHRVSLAGTLAVAVTFSPALAQAQLHTPVAERSYYGCSQFLCTTAALTATAISPFEYSSNVVGKATLLQPFIDQGFTEIWEGWVRPVLTMSTLHEGWHMGQRISLVGAVAGTEFTWSAWTILPFAPIGPFSQPGGVSFYAYGPGGASRTVGTGLTVTPEPSTWALLGTGLLAVGGVAARCRKGSAAA